ncbi:MAG TPA: nuclear transport factor 2 family protein, partial [Actinomycetota bacterium]|nr:nuclear transport factor 2 family protein [Actinomycetota bacterium]
FSVLLKVFEDFSYIDELHEEGRSVLVFEARVADRKLQGIDLVRTDSNGLINDFTVMVRPLSGVNALAEAVGSLLGISG